MQRSSIRKLTCSVLCFTLVIFSFLSMRYGAVELQLHEIISALQKSWFTGGDMTLNERIFYEIRFPRALLCVVVGAALSVGGVLMQALFRNPIVEPGLVGTSSGAAFGATVYFVLGSAFQFHAGEWTLPIAACLGAFLATFLVFAFSHSKHSSKSSIVALLLTGIAINALFMSGVGFLSYIARDPQARSITFWGLGAMSGANWHNVAIVGTTTIICIFGALRYAKSLNALMIGEDEALHLGINAKKLKIVVLSINVIMVAVATAFVGVIGFVGLIVPHVLRMLYGSDNRFIIRDAVLLGGLLLCAADFAARMILSPAELPIGIVTSLIGVPIFIVLLRKKTYHF